MYLECRLSFACICTFPMKIIKWPIEIYKMFIENAY